CVCANSLNRTVVEILEKREGFDRAAGFGGHDIQRLRRVVRFIRVQDSAGVGAVEYTQIEVAFCCAEGFGKHLRREAGTAHAEQQRMSVTIGAHRIHQPFDRADRTPRPRLIHRLIRNRPYGIIAIQFLHDFSDIQPAEAIADLSRVGTPHCMIALPDAPDDVLAFNFVQRSIYRTLIGFHWADTFSRMLSRLAAMVFSSESNGAINLSTPSCCNSSVALLRS